ncbi:hypothetical protein AAE478_001522 [Parahypoxylon ruwenzoriense]
MANHGVPKTAEVIPGAAVNIVLKADQRTGREVTGTVRDVLTRGDHHRGIKVRLTDGRIGRVQSMASIASNSSSSSSSGASGSASCTPAAGSNIVPPPTDDIVLANSSNAAVSQPRGRRPRYRDALLQEPLQVAPEQTDLGAYIVPAKRKGKGKGRRDPTDATGQSNGPTGYDRVSPVHGSNNAATDVTSATATCPVCGAFEGDEIAVAHHVAEHFE